MQETQEASPVKELPAEIDYWLRSKLPAAQVSSSSFRGQSRVCVDRPNIWESLRALRDDAGFDMLFELTAVDYLEYEGARDRFGIVYGLLSIDTGKRLIVKTFVNEPDLVLPTVTDLWKSADWMEREVYDMFGIVFTGHPNLKRLLLPTEFTSFPLRKDYPVKGRGERHNFPIITRAES
ncbi:NADH-quinone oxidoreductase subunit C [bacterium]|jgi:NADH-quinone oxidoreductase subunit C|nr:NADH-quinone oxidoreductase subunit C [bacterium]